MRNRRLLLRWSLVTVAAGGVLVAGCSTSQPIAPDDSGGAADGSSTPSPGMDAGDPCHPDPTTLLDDMTDTVGNRNATGGYWYTYSDRTVPNSEPPIVLTLVDGGAAPGSIVPPEGQPFPVTAAGPISGCTWNYREVAGGGMRTWGAGFGMDFDSVPPDGSEVAFNMCDAGEIFDVHAIDSGTVGIVQPYDASQWTGIRFWGISFKGNTQPVYVQMDDDRTSPWGGICSACNSTAGTAHPCSDSFREGVSFGPTWKLFQIAFADMQLTPQNWSTNAVKAPIDKNKIYNLHFQVTQTPTPAFDLGVAMLTFYR